VLTRIGWTSSTLNKCQKMRILCCFNHYYGTSSEFHGKSTTEPQERRFLKVFKALNSLKELPFSIDLVVCGFANYSLIPVDIDFSTTLQDPRLLVYASIERMTQEIEAYDYFLNIEDDILLNSETISSCLAFNKISNCNEVFLPNRIEFDSNGTYQCVDLVAMPGWRHELKRKFRGVELGVAHNPHSGLSFLSQEQLKYAIGRIDLSIRESIIGGLMASAFAKLHAPFLMWRAKSYLRDHYVEHLDHWMGRS
jgi:hypothetical protein